AAMECPQRARALASVFASAGRLSEESENSVFSNLFAIFPEVRPIIERFLLPKIGEPIDQAFS
ncbi:MAG TPA: hypothetical protein DCY45_02245, partial [Mesotoga sp.]|nr:hypothetical protein [Mesotoga sp.]